MPRRRTPNEYHALAKKRGFIWLGPEVPNGETKTKWRCSKGHEWLMTCHMIQQGQGCLTCGIKSRVEKHRKKPSDYRMLAKRRGFLWLGPKVKAALTKTWWQCTKGHKWPARYADINHGSGCPVCENRVPKTPDDYHALAQQRGFRWLGPEVCDTQSKTTWQCQHGHQWEARYATIQQRNGCPHCYGNVPKKPSDHHALAEARGFRWLGHEVRSGHMKTMWECSAGHQWAAPYTCIQQGKGCLICAGKARRTPAEYHALATQRGLEWLGPAVTNARTKTTWQCSQGHKWESPYKEILKGYGCQHCYGNAAKTPIEHHTLAKERGFTWLGPEVPNGATKTWWKCGEGHTWETAYDSVKQGRGCPTCACEVIGEKKRHKPDDYTALAESRGFRWLGPPVRDGHSVTWWQCSAGHKWQANYHNIQQGTGCPTCVDMVNGVRVSKPQRSLCKMLDGELNVPCSVYRIDVAVIADGVNIAVEYDSWFFHAGKEEQETERDYVLIEAGWRVLHVRSNTLLPKSRQLDAAISRLLAGEVITEIVLEDWGQGRTFMEANSCAKEEPYPLFECLPSENEKDGIETK